MSPDCKNCGRALKGNFCIECGQAADTHEINAHFLWHDIQHGLLHMDKGVLYSTRELFTRPGASIREYINGQRVKHFKPVSMLIVLASIYGLLYHFFDIRPPLTTSEDFKKVSLPGKVNFQDINAWIGTHYAFVTLGQLPIYALASWIAFKKSGYNYVKHLVLNAYLAAQRLLLHIALFPLEIIYNQTNGLLTISTLVAIVDVFLILWGYTTFFNQYPLWKSVLLTLLSYLLVAIIGALLAFLIGITFGMILK